MDGNRKSSLADEWRRASLDLDILIEGPAVFYLHDGTQVVADMLIPNFGTCRGTFVFTTSQCSEIRNAIAQAGYTVSTFGPFSEGGQETKEGIIEVLRDWGWCGAEDKTPKWLQDNSVHQNGGI